MPKSWFTEQEVTSLETVRPGGRIHIIGVCGVAMAQLAVLLSEKGYQVSGSDREFYEPMGSLLKNSGVTTCHGYGAGNVPLNADLVIIGNSISYGHDEVEVIEKHQLPYSFFPKVLYELIISSRHSIAVCGTHGKSTTTALIASMLRKLDLDPSYFVGGIAADLPSSLHQGQGNFCVVEGDEYDSAFFAKVPKFKYYAPETCLINAIEFDHADIYPDLNSIIEQFSQLVLSIPSTGRVICCIDFKEIEKLVSKWKSKAACKIITFGENQNADFRIGVRTSQGLTQTVEVESSLIGNFSFTASLPGEHNARNFLAAAITASELGLNLTEALQTFPTFVSVKRRQEVLYDQDGIVLIEDFAHHPTAVRDTIRAIRESYPNSKLRAVFEPRSNTSRRKIFQEDYLKAFQAANEVIISEVKVRAHMDAGHELLDVEQLAKQIEQAGIKAQSLPGGEAIRDYLVKTLEDNEVLLIMSNGYFDDLPAKLKEELNSR